MFHFVVLLFHVHIVCLPRRFRLAELWTVISDHISNRLKLVSIFDVSPLLHSASPALVSPSIVGSYSNLAFLRNHIHLL